MWPTPQVDGKVTSRRPRRQRPTPPLPLLVDRAALAEDRPAVVFDGSRFLVVWSIANGSGGMDIRAAHVSTGGGVLDAPPIVVAENVSEALAPAPTVAFSGDRYLVAWTDDRDDPGNTSDIYGARLTLDGVVLDPQGIPITTAGGGQYMAAAAGDGSGFLVTWDDHRSGAGIYAARVTAAGTVLDPAGIPLDVGHGSGWPAVGYGAGNYLVAWYDGRAGAGNEDIYATRVDLAGAVLDPAGLPIDIAGNQEQTPTIAFAGSHYMLAWNSAGTDYETPTSIRGAQVLPDGTVVDSYPLPLSLERGGQYAPQVASDASGRSLLAYTRFPLGATTNAPRVYVRLLAPSCTTNAACATGHCVDGVCCDTACTGTCMACKVAGSVGTCSPVPATSPDPVATTPCTGSKACDGAGTCKLATGGACAAATQCASGLCVDSVCCATACDGLCQVCGASGVCGGCPSSQYCDGAACVPRQSPGAACASFDQCQSRHCVDGVCCDGACTGDCERCTADGHCTTATDGTDPRGRCAAPPSGAAACGGTCQTGQCAYPGIETPCALCAACDGTGRCTATPADDAACGTITCGGLSTACRVYDDLVADRCASFAACKPANDPGSCTAFTERQCDAGVPGGDGGPPGQDDGPPGQDDAGPPRGDGGGPPGGDGGANHADGGNPPAQDGGGLSGGRDTGCGCRAATPGDPLVLLGVVLVLRYRRRGRQRRP